MKYPLENERGSALVEFVAVSVLLLVPVVYLILTLFSIQAATFAAEGVARESARVISEARTESSARIHAQAIAQTAAIDLGIEPEQVELNVSCAKNPCLTPSARVDVRVAIVRPLPLMPAFLADRLPARVSVVSSSASIVNPYLER